MSDPSTRWAAVVRRDAAHSDTFVYCVKTTRIFCRPTCKARLARRTNVFFCDTAAEALGLGYRACKRCRPEEGEGWETPEREKVRRAVGVLRALVEDAGGELVAVPSLESLAGEVGLTKWHFWRLFRREVGCTPKEFVGRVREEKARGVASEGSASTGDELSPVTPGTNLSENLPPLQIVDGEDEAGLDWSHLLTGPDPYGYDLIGYTLDDTLSKEMPSLDQVDLLLIYYDIVSTTYGNLLVAFQGDQVCKLELDSSETELMASLETSFPSLYYIHSHVSLAEQTVALAYQQRVDAVVDALEFPTGKMLDVPMSLGAGGGAVAG